MAEYISCETKILKSGSKVYTQYSCDSIWTTLENIQGQKKIIFSLEAELYGYDFRLGCKLKKEFKNCALFRWGCVNFTGCTYALIDNKKGTFLREINGFIHVQEEILKDVDFIMYFSDTSYSSLIIDFVDKHHKIDIPLKKGHFGYELYDRPEFQFDVPTISNKTLKLPYSYTKDDKRLFDTVIADLKQ